MRRAVVWTVFGALVFYPTSALISTHNEKYRDLFAQLPGGEWLADYADENGWEQFGLGTISQQLVKLTSTSKDDIQAKIAEARRTAESKAHDAAALARSSAHDAQQRIQDAAEAARAKASDITKQASTAASDMAHKAEKAAADAKVKADKLATDARLKVEKARDTVTQSAQTAATATAGVADAIVKDTKEAAVVAADKAAEVADDAAAKTEEAISTHRFPDTAKPRPLRPETVTPQHRTYEGQEKYGEKLPIGFEPPPGFYIPPPPPKPKGEEAAKLPLLAPQVKEFGADEPIIGQLATTIDSLATSLSSAKGAVSSQAADILARAQGDLSALNSRLDDVKKSEQARLQKTVDAKTREFETQLATKEKEWQKDEINLKSTWEAERQKMIDGWRDVLDSELENQRKGIEAR